MGKQRKRSRNVEGSGLGMKCMGAVIYLLLPLLFLMLVICIWVMKTLLPASILHLRFSNCTLNVYCVSASTTRFPNQESLFHDDTFNFCDHEIQGLKVAKHGLNVAPPMLNEFVNGHGLVALKWERPTTHIEISSQEKFENGSSEWAIMGKKKTNANNVTFSLSAVKMQMEAFRYASMPAGMKDPNQKQCKARKIYVYDLPKIFNAELVEQCHSLIPWPSLCDYFTKGGMGKPIEKFYKQWFQTHQYVLELILHSKISGHVNFKRAFLSFLENSSYTSSTNNTSRIIYYGADA